ncbi:membrane-bound transcription factor site-2 protease homolog isoform X1 [Coffea arabica]|uniref:Endopeptidase S2P n=2 Tax=Coffea arabica TaxID=13443 RepID=A0A6P6UFP9_COFAR
MEGRRIRRFGRGSQSSQTLLPLRLTRLTNAVSCWYCDFKTSVLNEPLYRYGRRHSRCLRVWFSVGLGFSLTALLGVILILLWEFGGAIHLYKGNDGMISLFNGSLFGFSSSISGLIMSLPDIGYIFLSSILSVFIHEVGHALAAASEGIQMEYIAVFLAVLFPGALVALNEECLQALPRNAALRIYCAGIWHNATFCVVCALVLFLLPSILDPFYIHGESPMVLYVSPMSPLFGYLSPHDLIISLDGTRIHNVQQWKEKVALLNWQLENLHNSGEYKGLTKINGRIGYCVPSYLIRNSMQLQLEGNYTSCPDELFALAASPCLNPAVLDNVSIEDNRARGSESIYCLNPMDVIKLRKCGDGVRTLSDQRRCSCLEEEYCFAPVQMPGLAWVEITYSRPASPGCRKLARNWLPRYENSVSGETSCVSSFTFVGDLITLGHALHLTSYEPRWLMDVGASLPNMLEKLFICAFHVSLSLALLNSLPVYFLDGECILEVILQYFNFLRPRARRKVLQWVLVGGTILSIHTFLRMLIVKF